MVDKIKPLKIESTPDGSVTDMYPVECNPAQDYAAVKGISFENTDTRIFDLSAGGEVQYKDAVSTSYKTLNSLGLFGSFYTYTEDLTETSTTSTTTYSTKLTLTTPSLVSGDYIVFYTLRHRRSSANSESNIRVRDGSTTLTEFIDSYIRTQGNNQRSGFVRLVGASGVKSITLEFKSLSAGTCFIAEARMTIWRVS